MCNVVGKNLLTTKIKKKKELTYFYYINTDEILSELSHKNLISSHVKISQLPWLHNKPHLSDQKSI